MTRDEESELIIKHSDELGQQILKMVVDHCHKVGLRGEQLYASMLSAAASQAIATLTSRHSDNEAAMLLVKLIKSLLPMDLIRCRLRKLALELDEAKKGESEDGQQKH